MLRFFNRLMLEDDTLRWSPYFKDMGFQGGESQLEESDATIISGAYERQYQMTEPMVARDNITFAWIGESTILLWRIVQAARTGGVVPEDWDAEPLFSKHLEMGIVDYFEFMQASGRSLGPIQKQCLPNYFEQALRSDPNAEEYRFETESHPRLAWVHALLEALRPSPGEWDPFPDLSLEKLIDVREDLYESIDPKLITDNQESIKTKCHGSVLAHDKLPDGTILPLHYILDVLIEKQKAPTIPEAEMKDVGDDATAEEQSKAKERLERPPPSPCTNPGPPPSTPTH
ncbi:hypothetical protein FRB99_007537 [Tulasnella sp. 403]|nr:hypothetical protein FRB99_007537 [Tulasnella sp. 403]